MPRRFVASPDSEKPLTPEQQKIVDDAVEQVLDAEKKSLWDDIEHLSICAGSLKHMSDKEPLEGLLVQLEDNVAAFRRKYTRLGAIKKKS